MNHTIKLNSQDIHKFKEQMKQQEKLSKRIHLIFFFSCILFVFVLLAKYSPTLYNGENFDKINFLVKHQVIQDNKSYIVYTRNSL